MGLEGVEIVIEVEQTFDIVIADSEAEKIATPGQLIELVLSKVGRTDHAACLTQRAFHHLRASLMRQLGCRRNQIKPETLLEDLFPRSNRKPKIRQILTDLGVQKEIELVRPKWLTLLLLTMLIFGAIATAAFLPGFLFLILFGWLAFFSTRRLQIEFRPSLATVAHLSRWLVATAPQLVNAPPGQWSREQVAEHIRQIVIDILPCEKTYRENAHFVKDLGMG